MPTPLVLLATPKWAHSSRSAAWGRLGVVAAQAVAHGEQGGLGASVRRSLARMLLRWVLIVFSET